MEKDNKTFLSYLMHQIKCIFGVFIQELTRKFADIGPYWDEHTSDASKVQFRASTMGVVSKGGIRNSQGG